MNDAIFLCMVQSFLELGKRIAGLRKDMGITQSELARLVNETVFAPKVSQSQIANIEGGKGKHWPSARLLGGLALVLRSSTDYILGLTDDQSAYAEEKDQVVVAIDDPDRRAKVQAVAEVMRTMSDADITLIAQLATRISVTADAQAAFRKNEIEENDRLWTSIFMLVGAHETQRFLDAGIPASDHFRRMVKIAVAREQETSNQRA